MTEPNVERLERARLVSREHLPRSLADVIARMDPEEVSTLIHRVSQHQPLELEPPARVEPGFVF